MGWVWTRRRLRAAAWVIFVLGQEGVAEDDLLDSWMNLPLAGIVDLPELESALAELMRVGLVVRDMDELRPVPGLEPLCQSPDDESPRLLLAFLLEYERPLWLSSATSGGEFLSPELVPDDALDGIRSVLPDARDREAFLLARARVVDAEVRAAIGSEGEELTLKSLCSDLHNRGRADLAKKVRRVSLVSDELGYDISAPWIDGSIRRIEVKSTVSSGGVVALYLSRNEATVGHRDPDWYIVVARVRSSNDGVLGWLSLSEVEHLLPVDRHERGSWQTARLKLDVRDLNPGLPFGRADEGDSPSSRASSKPSGWVRT